MRLSTKIWRKMSGKSFLIGATTFFAVVAFTVTGVTSSIGGVDGNVAAKVGDEIISLKTLQNVVARQGRQQSQDENARSAEIKDALDNLIQEQVIVADASRLGWSGSDMEVAYWIKSIPSFQEEDTKTFSKKKYDQFLSSGQMSELELFQEGRNSIATQKYSAMMGLDSHIPTPLAKEYAQKDGASFTLEYLEIKATDSAIAAALSEKSAAYLADAANTQALQNAYDSRKAEYNRPAGVRVSSILVAHREAQLAQGEVLERSKEDAQKKALDTLQQLNSGAQFATLSDQSNDDFKAKAAKGDLGFVDANSLDPASLAAAEQLTQDGQLSAAIDTPFGFRILKRTGHRGATVRTFEEAKAELAEKQVRPGVLREANEAIVKLFDAALAPTPEKPPEKNLATLMTEYNLNWSPVAEPVTPSSRFISEIGLAEPVVKRIFELRQKGDLVPQVLEVSGKNILIRLVERKETEVDTAKIDSARDLRTAQMRQKFATESRRKLYDIYSGNREIKRNASLFAQNSK